MFPASNSEARHAQAVVVDLTAVVVAVTADEPRALVLHGRAGASPRGGKAISSLLPSDALPSGPLELQHRTLEAGLRAWVQERTGVQLGYVEQLYTFGDRNRTDGDKDGGRRVLSIGYLALTREAGKGAPADAAWHDWYRYFPWEDRRRGDPAILDRLQPLLRRWVEAAPGASERAIRQARLTLAFGSETAEWSDERVLERYELLYEIGLVPEAHRDGTTVFATSADVPAGAQPMAADHRRILATAIARMRAKIKYRPVVFELMPPSFTLLQLQKAVEALAGFRLHKQNFRRLVAQQGLVEETGHTITGTGGRPAREVRFRREATWERPAPGLRLPIDRGTR